MRLRKAQREALIAWIAEGLQTDEINGRASQFEPEFSVSRTLVDHYRRTRKVDIDSLIQAGQDEALHAGLALRSERVRRLKQLAGRLEEDLLGDRERLWVKDRKAIGSGPFQEFVEFEEFNSAEVREYRGVLDDIAKELGDRKLINEISGKDGEPLFKVYRDTTGWTDDV